MSVEKIREEIEKIRTLSKLQEDLSRISNASSASEIELVKTKLQITKDEMLKSNYNIGKLLKQIEEKV